MEFLKNKDNYLNDYKDLMKCFVLKKCLEDPDDEYMENFYNGTGGKQINKYFK